MGAHHFIARLEHVDDVPELIQALEGIGQSALAALTEERAEDGPEGAPPAK